MGLSKLEKRETASGNVADERVNQNIKVADRETLRFGFTVCNSNVLVQFFQTTVKLKFVDDSLQVWHCE